MYMNRSYIPKKRKLGELIQIYRDQAGLTQAALANLSGIDLATVKRAEHPQPIHEVSVVNIRKLIRALDERLTFTGGQLRELVDSYVLVDSTPSANTMQDVLGVIVPQLRHDTFWSALVSAIETRASAAGYRILVCQHMSNIHLQNQQIESFQDVIGLSGVIIAPTERYIDASATRSFQRAIKDLRHRGIPTVFVDRAVDIGIPVSFVGLDNVLAARKAVDFLIAHGHYRIGLVLAKAYSRVQKDRHAGYQQSLMMHNIPYDEKLVMWGDDVAERDIPLYGYDMARTNAYDLLRRKPTPTAIFCSTYRVAISVVGSLQELNKSETRFVVPDDISLIAVDDVPELDMFDPPISRVSFRMSDFAEIAVNKIEILRIDPESNDGLSDHLLNTHEIRQTASVKNLIMTTTANDSVATKE